MNKSAQDLLVKLAIYAGVGVALYYVIKNIPAAISAGATAGLKALENVGSALGTGLYERIHPGAVGETVFHIVTFPNGSRHSIPSGSVNDKGQFRYALIPEVEKTWQLLKDVQTGKWVAARV
jgi:hypothetical protein